MQRNAIIGALAALATILALAVPFGARAQTQPANGTLRIIHAAAGAPSVDVLIDGQRALASRDYFSVSSAIDLQPGSHEVRLVRPGESRTLIGKVLDIEPGEAYTLAVIGSDGDLQGVIYEDSASRPEAAEARVRIIHAAPGAGTVDVAVAGQAPFLTNAVFGQAAYSDLPAGTYPLDLSRGGQSLLRTVELTFVPGWSYTLVVTGDQLSDVWVQASVDGIGR